MRIGTRGSALALAQARLVAERLDDAEIVVVSTSGDRGERGGDKARWVDAIEQALLAGKIDLAVHSAKDVPSALAQGLAIVGCPPRADCRDVLCGAPSLAQLPAGARVGTSSLRRVAQLRALRDDLELVELRGNVDTRLRRLSEGNDFDAIVLARAGLERLGHDTREHDARGHDAQGHDVGRQDVCAPLDELIPAAGQGTLALQARSDDDAGRTAIAPLRDPDTERALATERSLVRALNADCYTALGAHARIDGPRIELRAWIGLEDGSAWITDSLSGVDPQELGREVAERMLGVGAGEMLAASAATPPEHDGGGTGDGQR